jgi:rhamnosyltransferase subunit B
VRLFDYLPYSAVFPSAAAIVHSGGVGTLAQALAAGRPQLIVPVAFDQPDNARRAAALGVARRIPFAKATAAAMARELADIMSGQDYERRARAIGDTLTRENGARAAAEALERAAG